MDATGSGAGTVLDTPVADAPEGAAPPAGSSPPAAVDTAEGLAREAPAPAQAAEADRPGEREALAAPASRSTAADAAPPPGAAPAGQRGLPRSAVLAEEADARPVPAASAIDAEAVRKSLAAEQARLEALARARTAAEARLAQLQEEARREQATRHEVLARRGAALAPPSSATSPLTSQRAEPASGTGSGVAPGAATSNSGHQRVVLHHRAGSHAASQAAGAMAAQVREAGFDLGGTRAVTATPSQRVVRYFRAEDAPAATRLAGRLGRGWALQDFRAYQPLPPRGLLEVWLPDR